MRILVSASDLAHCRPLKQSFHEKVDAQAECKLTHTIPGLGYQLQT
jgi:hypothetical protein